MRNATPAIVIDLHCVGTTTSCCEANCKDGPCHFFESHEAHMIGDHDKVA